MSKRLLYVVALAFILQLSWGTASAYCMHEMDKTSQHFGHHQHEHADGNAAESGKSPQKKASVHPDCATCAHGAIFITEFTGDRTALLLPDHQARIPSRGQAAPYLGLPERPRWLRAV